MDATTGSAGIGDSGINEFAQHGRPDDRRPTGRLDRQSSGRSYAALFHETCRMADNLHRHLSGHGFASLETEAEAIRAMGRKILRYMHEDGLRGTNVIVIEHAVHSLEAAITKFERALQRIDENEQPALVACDTVKSLVNLIDAYLRRIQTTGNA